MYYYFEEFSTLSYFITKSHNATFEDSCSLISVGTFSPKVGKCLPLYSSFMKYFWSWSYISTVSSIYMFNMVAISWLMNEIFCKVSKVLKNYHALCGLLYPGHIIHDENSLFWKRWSLYPGGLYRQWSHNTGFTDNCTFISLFNRYGNRMMKAHGIVQQMWRLAR